MIKFIDSTPHFEYMETSRIIIIYNVFTLPSYLKKIVIGSKKNVELNVSFCFNRWAGRLEIFC